MSGMTRGFRIALIVLCFISLLGGIFWWHASAEHEKRFALARPLARAALAQIDSIALHAAKVVASGYLFEQVMGEAAALDRVVNTSTLETACARIISMKFSYSEIASQAARLLQERAKSASESSSEIALVLESRLRVRHALTVKLVESAKGWSRARPEAAGPNVQKSSPHDGTLQGRWLMRRDQGIEIDELTQRYRESQLPTSQLVRELCLDQLASHLAPDLERWLEREYQLAKTSSLR